MTLSGILGSCLLRALPSLWSEQLTLESLRKLYLIAAFTIELMKPCIVQIQADYIAGKDVLVAYAIPAEPYTNVRLRIPLDSPEELISRVKLEIMLIPYD